MNRKLIAGGLIALLCLAKALLALDTPMDTTFGSTSKITYTSKTINYPHDPFTCPLGTAEMRRFLRDDIIISRDLAADEVERGLERRLGMALDIGLLNLRRKMICRASAASD